MTIRPENINKLLITISNSNEAPDITYLKSAVGSFGNEDVFNRIVHFCEENKLIRYIERALDKSKPTQITNCLEITDEGIKFLMEQERIDEQKKHDRIIKCATIIIAIATVVNVIIGSLK